MEMDFFMRSPRWPRLGKIRNSFIRKKIGFRLHKIQSVEQMWSRVKNE